jgi:hypothetical protein
MRPPNFLQNWRQRGTIISSHAFRPKHLKHFVEFQKKDLCVNYVFSFFIIPFYVHASRLCAFIPLRADVFVQFIAMFLNETLYY